MEYEFSTLKEAREFMGMSQQQIATDFGVSTSTWARWESSTNNPRWLRLAMAGRIQEFKALAPEVQAKLQALVPLPGRPSSHSLNEPYAIYIFPLEGGAHLTKPQRLANVGNMFWAYYEYGRTWEMVVITDSGLPVTVRTPVVDSSDLLPMPIWLREHLTDAERQELAKRYDRPDYA